MFPILWSRLHLWRFSFRRNRYSKYLCKPTGKYETLVSGSDLTLDEFHAAESAFEKHGGTRKNRQEPDKNIKPVRVEDGDTSKVNYKEKINDNNSIYEVYAAEKKADALAFLKFKSVHKPNFYIVVDTPSLSRTTKGARTRAT